ncbi:unnamed protein product, partial [Meganyctiphanes norvegica]
ADWKDVELELNQKGAPTTIALCYRYKWSNKLKKDAEKIMVQYGVKESYIRKGDVDFILNEPRVLDHIYIKGAEEAAELLWSPKFLNVKKHYEETWSHRLWLMRTFQRLVKLDKLQIFENIDKETQTQLEHRCDIHDLSKFRLDQAVGYALRWVHKIDSPIWYEACNLHLMQEDHHPQHYFSRTTIDLSKPVNLVKGLDHSDDERMDILPLLESILDMIASRWERALKGDLAAPTHMLVNIAIEQNYLDRYCPCNYDYAVSIYQKISKCKD